MSSYYADTPAVSLLGALAAWGSGLALGQPAAEMVALTLRTEKGSYAPDPDEGVDSDVIEIATANVGVRWKAEVERALSRYVRNGVIRDLRVSVEVSGDRLLYDVEFVDPRDTRNKGETRGRVTLRGLTPP